MPYAQPPESDAETRLQRARSLAQDGKNDQAFAAYIAVLQQHPDHHTALHELAHLAHRNGHRSAARTSYAQLVNQQPSDTVARVNLGSILYDEGDLHGAQAQFGAALAIDVTLTEPHRGLARIAQDLGESETADRHWRQSFPEQAIAAQPYRGKSQPVCVLVLVSARGGNIPTQYILDDCIHAVTALYAEYYRPDLPLPPHDLIFNTIGDADLCGAALEAAQAIVARSGKPVINHPARVRDTDRAANAQRLGGLPGVITPKIRKLRRDDIQTLPDSAFPVLLRAPGFHGGEHFLRAETRQDAAQAAADLPGEDLLAIEFLDARGADGLVRKYRVMCIDGALYPLHLAISADWKVHYFSADMLDREAHRAEERHFLENMPAVLGPRVLAALSHIVQAMGLDYAGVDFAVGRDGSLLLFEANATMLINPPAQEAVWDYRRPSADRALAAARKLLEMAI